MKTKWKWLFWGLLFLIIVGMIAFPIAFQVFTQSGIHILGNYAHVSLQQDCYFIDTAAMEVTGSSTFVVSGYLFDKFTGYMNVAQYPMTVENISQAGASGFVDGLNKLTLSNHSLTLDPNWQYYYYVNILKSDPNVIVIQIAKKDHSVITAVCADSPEQAIANYQTYLERFSD